MATNVVNTVTILFNAYGVENNERKKIYSRCLADIPDELLMATVQKVITESKFLPSVAEILEKAESIKATATGNTGFPTFGEAWQEIEKAMYATPTGKKPTFSHKLIEQTVNQFGWNALVTCQADEFSIIRSQIRKMYESNAERFVEKERNEKILARNPRVQALLGKVAEAKMIGG